VKRLLISSGLFFATIVYFLVLSLASVKVLPDPLGPQHPPGFFNYRGVFNVQSSLSGGSGSTSEIVQAGVEAGLDFIVLTDLNVFGGEPTPSGYNRQMLLISGQELSYLESRLLTADMTATSRFESLGQAQTALADRLSQGQEDGRDRLLLLAHPTREGYSWSGSHPSGLDGLEIINLKSIWQSAWQSSKASFLWSFLIYPFNAQLALLRLYEDPVEEARLWDRLLQQRPAIGLLGSAATARAGPVGRFYVRFPSYQTMFSLGSNHVLLASELTGDAASDRRRLLSAIQDGQFFFAIDALGDPRGFNVVLKDRDRVWPMGSRVRLRPGLALQARLPAQPTGQFEIAILRDGQHLASFNSREASLEIDRPGVYRVIVRVVQHFTVLDGQRWLTWIYSNPIYIN
jgi:hypothetical protein